MSTSQKIPNIPTRYNCSKEARTYSNYQHPEKSHLLKYFPKYYKHLTIDISYHNPLLSKIKRIKTLKRLTGLFKVNFRESQWLTLLKNHRKSLEEIPQIISSNPSLYKTNVLKSSQKRLNLQLIKHLPNLTRVCLPRTKAEMMEDENSLFIPDIIRSPVKHLRNLRKLKTLEIYVNKQNSEVSKWLLGRLDKMERLLSGLQALKIEIQSPDLKLQEVFQHQRVLYYLTGLTFAWIITKFDPSIGVVPQACKNLRCLKIGFAKFFSKSASFGQFLKDIQKLTKLVGLEFNWSQGGKRFMEYLKPQASLRYLRMGFDVSDLAQEVELEDIKQLLEHWEEIKDLESLEFHVECVDNEDIVFTKHFITGILKKIMKLRIFKCKIYPVEVPEGESGKYEPFVIEQVPHLYGSLERVTSGIYHPEAQEARFPCDLGMMRPFKRLKKMKIFGNMLAFENIEDAVGLLEENSEASVLKIGSVYVKNRLRDMLERVEKVKRKEKDLKIKMDLSLQVGYGKYELNYLEGFCSVMKMRKAIDGLVIWMNMFEMDRSEPNVDGVKQVLRAYPMVRNFMLRMDYLDGTLEYMKIDGRGEQLFVDS